MGPQREDSEFFTVFTKYECVTSQLSNAGFEFLHIRRAFPIAKDEQCGISIRNQIAIMFHIIFNRE